MGLQFIIGSSGTGKSHYAFETILKEAQEHPEQLFYVIVPEQFTMQTQKQLVEMSPGKGILNIDILSFERLAYRVFEETGGDQKDLLGETGKSMVLQKMVQRHQKELPYLGSQMKKQGYLNEVKSLLSEFMQYDIREADLKEMIEQAGERNLLKLKLQDVGTLYQAFRTYLEDRYMTTEEVMDLLLKMLPFSEKLKNSVMLFDGFTGFTPIQMNVIRELLILCKKISVTVTMNAYENPYEKGKIYKLFYMSRKMVQTLAGLTKEIEDPVLLFHNEKTRFAKAPALQFLEKNIFRYQKDAYEGEQNEVQVFSASNPQEEMDEIARRITELVRVKGYRYGEMAVVTGNLEEYKNLAVQLFEASQIPYFIDEKHTVLMNPFVEYIRAALEMVTGGFTYESVFRYLRCGMSNLQREETDQLENYVIALGIRGFKKWEQKWVRHYRGMNKESIEKLNAYRERFVEEVKELNEGFGGEQKTIREYCTQLYQFIVRGDTAWKLKQMELSFQKAGNKAMEKEYAQIYGIVMDLMDKMVEILGEEKVSRQDFRQLFEAGLAEAKVALIPPSIDQVLVGDIERTRLKDIKALFFVGVNEGNIPKNTSQSGLLTELDRDFFGTQGIELAPGPKELMSIQRFYLYLNLTKPRELLCLSYYHSNSKGEIVAPAYLIGNIQRMFPDCTRISEQKKQDPLHHMEKPGNSLQRFLEELSMAVQGKETEVFQELYSWYLGHLEYEEEARNLIEAAFTRKPSDVITKSIAKVLYGEVSPYSATRLERYAACAFAHFLQYGLKITEREEYEFKAMDMGNVMHEALEKFALEIRKKGLEWRELTEAQRNEIIDQCLENVTADYGNTILKSSARNIYMIERTRRILHRTVWAIQEQLKNSEFQPEGFEVKFGGGRIDRVDILEDPDKVYVRVIDYKSGNTSFDLVSLYHGLQMQLLIYLDGAQQVEQRRFPAKEIVPAGIFYYNIKDPMIEEKMDADIHLVEEKILKELKMNGLVQADLELITRMDRNYKSLPVEVNKNGSFRKGSSVATTEQFQALQKYVKKKIASIQEAILEGDADISPYQMGTKNACAYCIYKPVCGFDKKIPGYQFRRLKNFSDNELWEEIQKEVE